MVIGRNPGKKMDPRQAHSGMTKVVSIRTQSPVYAGCVTIAKNVIPNPDWSG